jgi:hypothetical protein
VPYQREQMDLKIIETQMESRFIGSMETQSEPDLKEDQVGKRDVFQNGQIDAMN